MNYIKVIIACAVILFSIGESWAQRYESEITDSVKVNTYKYATKDGEELNFDIYMPALEFEKNKVVFVYVHGGGFSGGDRSGGKSFCTRLAKHGFAAISMSYRLTRKGTKTGFGCKCTANEKLATFQASVEDIQDATAYLIQNREQFGIDPQKIILGGSSAGAEAVLNAAYQPPYCYGLDSGPVKFAGVVSMAGAIPDLVKVYDESAIPSMFFHGTCDNLVPYATAPHHYCNEKDAGYIILHGGYSISGKLRELGKPYWLVTVCGGAHEWAGKPMTVYFDEIVRFCNDFVIKGKKEQVHTIASGDQTKCNYQTYNFCNL